MKIIFLFISLSFGQISPVLAKVDVSVTNFTNKSGESHCRLEGHHWGWYDDLGSSFREILEAELLKSGEIKILERKQIKKIYEDEHELINSKNVKKVEKGNFKQAKYTLVGAVTEYEYCDQDNGANVDLGQLIGFGSLKVGGASGQAKVVVQIKVVSVETGEVIKSAYGEGLSNASSVALDAGIRGVGAGIKTRKNSPLTKAAREAIEKAVPEILEAVVH